MDLLKETTVIIVTYNHQDFIENCLNSVLNQCPMEVIVVDNDSQDETVKIISNKFTQVKLILNPKNGGYSAGLNLGVKHSRGKYLFFVNPDTIVEKNAIQELTKPLKENDKVIATPKILLYDGSKVNTCGNVLHFTGLSFTRGFNSAPKEFAGFEEVQGISGACFAITRENYLIMGGFNENFFLYMEDTSFSWRAGLFGFKILYIPTAIIRHKYSLNVDPQKIYFLEKGRYIILRTYLTRKERMKIAPSLMISEILTWGFSIMSGFEGIKYKFKAMMDGLRTDVVKMQSDNKALLKSLDWEIPEGQLMDSTAAKILRKAANWVYRNNYGRIIGKDKMKVALICSHGGHLTEMLYLIDTFKEHDVFFVTYDNIRTKNLGYKTYLFPNFGETPYKMFLNILNIIKVLLKEKPNVVVSNGAEIAIPFFYLGKLLRIKTIFIECYTRIDTPTITGKLVYPVSTLFLVLWPEMLSKYGKKAKYWGGLFKINKGSTPKERKKGKIFVITGMHSGFDRLVKKVDEIAGEIDERFVIQTGNTEYVPKNAKHFKFKPYDQIKGSIKGSKIVICQGAMTILDSLMLGTPVITVPRLKEYDEVINDHQLIFAEKLEKNGLSNLIKDENELKKQILNLEQLNKKEININQKLIKKLRDHIK